jgi:two-component system sensor histidine kinase RegB
MKPNTARFLPDIGSGRYANMQQLIQLRWLAVFGQLVTIAFSDFIFMMNLPLRQMLIVIVALISFNLLSTWYWRVQRSGESREVRNRDLFQSLLIDVLALTALLFFSGGAANPFSSLYLLQIVLGAAILEAASLWALIAVSSICFAGLTVTYHPLALLQGGLPDRYMQGMLVCYAINAALLGLFVTHINRKQRERDARLADLRQRALEEEHIVRMGLLASGAAHELSTPLSTMAVILGDWQHMPALKSEPGVTEDMEEMQRQVKRCKSIVTGILLSAGEARGEAPEETTVCTFLDELVEEWKTTRAPRAIDYINEFGEDLTIVSDDALKQTLCNVLDNALEASPAWVGLRVTRAQDTLVLTISDAGPGFPDEMLENIGKPYQSSKGNAGSGLGLFLVVNVIRTLGGTVAARNANGGAVVTLGLPLAALKLNKNKPT